MTKKAMNPAGGARPWSRRSFLRTAGAALTAAPAFPELISAAVLGREQMPPPSSRTTVACIGVGGMGMANLNGFLASSRARVLAVCDVDRDHRLKAKAAVDKAYSNADCATYNDFRELLERPDLDAVMIAVPDHWHALIAIAAAEAGLDIYCEKPLAFTISEGRAICDAVERHQSVWQTGSWQRSQRDFRFACELVRNGRLGEVGTVRVGLPFGNSILSGDTAPCDPPEGFDYDMWLGPAPWRPYNPSRCHWNFRWISDYSGGQLTDWAGHHCDIAQWGMGTELSSPVEVEGEATWPAVEDGLFDTPESYYFTCRYAEGFRMIVADSRQQPKGMGVHFQGSEGWIHVNRGGIDAHPKSLLRSFISPNEIRLYRSTDHIGNFLDCVRSRAETITPAQIAHRSIMIGHLGAIAMKLGRKVRWDGVAERFVDDPEADRLLVRPMRGAWQL